MNGISKRWEELKEEVGKDFYPEVEKIIQDFITSLELRYTFPQVILRDHVISTLFKHLVCFYILWVRWLKEDILSKFYKFLLSQCYPLEREIKKRGLKEFKERVKRFGKDIPESEEDIIDEMWDYMTMNYGEFVNLIDEWKEEYENTFPGMSLRYLPCSTLKDELEIHITTHFPHNFLYFFIPKLDSCHKIYFSDSVIWVFIRYLFSDFCMFFYCIKDFYISIKEEKEPLRIIDEEGGAWKSVSFPEFPTNDLNIVETLTHRNLYLGYLHIPYKVMRVPNTSELFPEKVAFTFQLYLWKIAYSLALGHSIYYSQSEWEERELSTLALKKIKEKLPQSDEKILREVWRKVYFKKRKLTSLSEDNVEELFKKWARKHFPQKTEKFWRLVIYPYHDIYSKVDYLLRR